MDDTVQAGYDPQAPANTVAGYCSLARQVERVCSTCLTGFPIRSARPPWLLTTPIPHRILNPAVS